MKNSPYWGLLLSCAITGCSTTSSLKQWTNEELSPYLVKELGQHPRFKQQPLILVDMQGEQVEAQIDDLTTEIRGQIKNTLLESKGINLIWQSSGTALQHHTRLQDIQCHAKQKSRYYIGFDLKPINDEFQLSVKALDPEQGSWVSGFGKTWQGSLTSSERRKLKKTHPDEVLRGLRPLPFTEQQMDLLANYLAKNISCLLQQGSLEGLTIYPEHNANQAAFINRTLVLVGNYLSRFNEVQIVSQPDKANIILKAQVHPIDKNLQQFWLIAEDKQAELHLKGVDTAAYVALSESVLNQRIAEQEPDPVPAVVVVPTPVVVVPVPAPVPVPVPAPVPVQVPVPAPVIIPPREEVHLFSELNLVSPIGEPFCGTTTPWVLGELPIQRDQTVSYCFGLSMRLNQDAEVFLMNENNQGQYYRLLPDSGQSRFKLFAGEKMRFPESNLFDVPANISQEYIHAIAVNDPYVAQKLHQLLRAMPECCNTKARINKAYWHTQLEAFRNQHSEHVDWQIIKVMY